MIIIKANILMSRSGGLVAKWAKPELQKYIKPNMKVVILGFSFFGELSEKQYFEMYGKESEYALKMTALFNDYQISDVSWLYYYSMTKEEIVDLINNADILYLPGGAPDIMMERIIEKDLLDELKSFDKTVIGSSAGSMIQLSHFHISPDNEYHKFSEHKGLGFLDDFFIEVHYARRRRQKGSMRKMRKTYLKPIYTIPDEGILVVSNNHIKTLGNAKKMYTKKGINHNR